MRKNFQRAVAAFCLCRAVLLPECLDCVCEVVNFCLLWAPNLKHLKEQFNVFRNSLASCLCLSFESWSGGVISGARRVFHEFSCSIHII